MACLTPVNQGAVVLKYGGYHTGESLLVHRRSRSERRIRPLAHSTPPAEQRVPARAVASAGIKLSRGGLPHWGTVSCPSGSLATKNKSLGPHLPHCCRMWPGRSDFLSACTRYEQQPMRWAEYQSPCSPCPHVFPGVFRSVGNPSHFPIRSYLSTRHIDLRVPCPSPPSPPSQAQRSGICMNRWFHK